MTVVSLDMAYRSFLEVLAGSHPPRYAASLKPSSPRFTHSSHHPRSHRPWSHPAALGPWVGTLRLGLLRLNRGGEGKTRNHYSNDQPATHRHWLISRSRYGSSFGF